MGRRPVPAAIAAARIALQWFLCQAALISCFASWKAVQPVFGQGGSGSLVADDLEALLAIKASFTDPFGALQSWNATGIGACQGVWAGVKCVDGEVTVLQLAGLGLGGTLSDQVGRLRNLRKLNVHTNQIGGPIPSPLASLAFLRAVYLHKNQFTGEIPEGLGVSALLQRVDLSANQLTGPIPEGLAMSRRLLFVNVSDNMLSGPVPQDWAQNPSVQVLSAARNELSGPLPEHWSTDQLQILELNGNSLNGNIPAGLGESSSLTLLNLEDNQFSGAIPPELGSLTSLQFLDVSGNRLTGTIPESLKNLPNLSTFDVSSNGLGGPIPVLARTFPSSSFAGNPGLCGVVGGLGSSCPGRKKDKKLSALAWVGIGLAIAIFTVGVAFIFALIVWRLKGGRRPGAGLASKRPEESPGSEGDLGGKLVHFDGPLAFTVDDLLRATAEVLGKSSYGTVYKATLEDGNSVAVKRLREGIVKGQKEFEAEIESLGALRHDNLLSLRAYYWGPKGEKLLVYDFMPLGSLAAFLHGSQTPLGWHTRLKIATGTARGLAFLHVKERIVHGNLTSSNVLLNRHMVPQISDYGLARVMTTSANSTVIATAGALGYRAPELTKLKKATFKSDVYSFGVILLELLTGKAPSDAMTGNSLQSTETTLPDWVASVVKEEWTNEVFDVDLMKDAPAEDELLTALQLALNCVVGTPAARPEMDEVVLHLEELSPAPLLASSAHQQPLRQDL